jgi:DNA-binding response OmpR family regulator
MLPRIRGRETLNHNKAILIVASDDAIIRLKSNLLDARYKVLIARTEKDMWATLAASPVNLVLLDADMDGGEGLALTPRIRSQSKAAILLLSNKNEDVDQVVGLEIGADDYITKPFSIRNLSARIKSVLRRYPAELVHEIETITNRSPPPRELTFGTWRFCPTTRRLLSPNNEETVLSCNESAVLSHMIQHSGHVLSRDDLMSVATGRNWQYMDRSVDILVARLRKKIEDDPSNPECIKTIRGVGYVFVDNFH